MTRLSDTFINEMADKFAAKIARCGGQAPARSAGEVIALQSGRFEATRTRQPIGWGYDEGTYRIKATA